MAVASPTITARAGVPKAAVADTIAVCAEVIAPTLAKGVIFRRPAMMLVADLLGLDGRAIRRMERVRDRYGPGPLILDLPGKPFALLLEPAHVRRVLQETPDPFAAATKEKRATLEHFEPRGVLISDGAKRRDRRRYNEEALDTGRPLHRHSEYLAGIVNSEADRLRAQAGARGEIGWGLFSEAWFRMVRRVVFGDAATDADELSATMARLRMLANWAFLAPRRMDLRTKLFHLIGHYMARSEPGSLAAMNGQPSGETAPEDQIAHWLFAFDAAGMTAFRTLALLTAHPSFARRVREELGSSRLPDTGPLPSLRAAVMECLRLWPTTPLILRATSVETQWEMGLLPAGVGIAIFTPFFHRDGRLPYADLFRPELWLGNDATALEGIVPFSDGPAACPGRNVVLLLVTEMLRGILNRARIRLAQPRPLDVNGKMPFTLNHYRLRFELKD